MSELANIEAVIAAALGAWRPPPKLTLSEWADEHFYLSAESSASVGRWKTIPYQKGIMDAFTDSRVTSVTCMKSARVGWTKIVNALIGFSIHQDPCPMLVVQPTVEDAKGYSKEEIAPMIRDCPGLAAIVYEEAEEVGPRDSGNTILHKRFPGGVLSLVGANSGAGFRRVSRKRVLFDEVDAYPPSAGSDGDPVKLGTKRAEYYWDRKIGHGSTPLVAGASRIEDLFLQGDQRRYYVPCPECGHMDFLVFTEREGGGHFMVWPDGEPKAAHFVCSKNGCVIDHKHKRDMVARGEWRASTPFDGHASFHVWAAYSYSPNASWGQLAEEFLEAKGDREKLKTFVNTVLGETWKESGEAPEWERLYQRREHYPMGSVPAGVVFLTCGVDVQKDRWVFEVVGWGANKESWSIEAGVIPGHTEREDDWAALDAVLNRSYLGADGRTFQIMMLAVDSGYNTQQVYNWGRRHERNRVIAVKGQGQDKKSASRTLVGSPTPVDVLYNGVKYQRGYKVWPVGADIAKSELYGWLRLQPPTVESKLPYPAGFLHFPEHGEDYFKQLTGEHLVTTTEKRTGRKVSEWQIIPGRENHYLDARVYARVAAMVLGLDRLTPPPLRRPLPTEEQVVEAGARALDRPREKPPRTGRLMTIRAKPGSWFAKKR